MFFNQSEKKYNRHNSFYTKKKITQAVRQSKRKAQRIARRINRR